jgi:hypothetical protein
MGERYQNAKKGGEMKKVLVLALTLVLLIALTIPMAAPVLAGGCDGYSPGYWKNHPDDWPAPYSPGDDFDTVLGVNWFEPDITLMAALWLHGNGINRDARYAAADLLNGAL